MNYNGGRIRNSEIRSILEVRSALDTLAAELCVEHISDEDVETLREKVETIRTAKDISEATQAAFEFQHEFAMISGNTLSPLIFQSFKAPIFTLWERFCTLYGIETLYQSNYTTWSYIRNRDVDGTIHWIHQTSEECITGKWKLYY